MAAAAQCYLIVVSALPNDAPTMFRGFVFIPGTLCISLFSLSLAIIPADGKRNSFKICLALLILLTFKCGKQCSALKHSDGAFILSINVTMSSINGILTLHFMSRRNVMLYSTWKHVLYPCALIAFFVLDFMCVFLFVCVLVYPQLSGSGQITR